MRKILVLVALGLFLLGMARGEQDRWSKSTRGHFFLPPRNLFYVRPDLYVPRLHYNPSYRHGSRNRYSGYCPTNADDRLFPGLQPRGTYQIILNSPSGKGLIRANTADLIFRVVPVRARVYVDGSVIGSAEAFSNKRNSYSVIEGEHNLRVEYPGYRAFSARMEVVPDRTLHLDIELERLPGK